MQGRFRQLVSQQLDVYYKDHVKETCKSNLPDSSRMGGVELVDIIEKLIENGVSERNAEIFSKNTFGGYSKVDLAKEYKLTRMTIHRICKHIIKIIKENNFL
jgi:Mor family transcriptional regulator